MKNPLAFLFSRDETNGKVPNREILSYAFGLTGQNISYSYLSGRLTYFYENHAVSRQRASVVGKIITGTYVWDAINDVIIGAVVDKKSHKPLNKLRPYLLYLPPFIGIFGAMMFLRMGNNDIVKLVYLGLLYCIWDFLYSFQDVALWGMISLSSPHSHERSRVAQWVSIGAGAGAAVAGAFPFIWGLFDKLPGFKEDPSNERLLFSICGFIFVLGGELLSMRAHKFHERVDAPVQQNETIWQTISILRHNPTLLLISLARFSQGFTPKVNQTYFFQSEYRNSSSALLNGGLAETIYGLASGIPGAVAIFFATRLIDLVGGTKRLLQISQITAIVTRLAAYGIGSTARLNYKKPVGFIIMCLMISICNIPGSLMDIAHRSLTSDSIDEVELKTGLRSEGVSFSMQNFTTKMTSGVSTYIQNFFLFNVLGYFTSDDKSVDYIEMQSEKFYKAQFPLFILGPIVGAVLYIVIISFVRDSKEHRDDVERQLRERRAEANASIAAE